MAISHPDDDPNPAHPNHSTDPHMAELPHTLSATQLQPFSLPQRLLAESNTAPPSRPYTANASARTSYTRVDAAGLEDALRVVEVDPEQSQGDGESKEGSVDEREEIPQTPQISLTFLLISGKRRTMGFEPETTVGRVKELVWNAWPGGKYPSNTKYKIVNTTPHRMAIRPSPNPLAPSSPPSWKNAPRRGYTPQTRLPFPSFFAFVTLAP